MKYTIDRWIHAHYISTVEANSFEEAVELANCGCDETDVDFSGLDIGNSGITSIEDENGQEFWCE